MKYNFNEYFKVASEELKYKYEETPVDVDPHDVEGKNKTVVVKVNGEDVGVFPAAKTIGDLAQWINANPKVAPKDKQIARSLPVEIKSKPISTIAKKGFVEFKIVLDVDKKKALEYQA